jgi:tetratricopeptide (TPR) repeat protein
MRQAVFVATLTGPLPHGHALAAIKRAGVETFAHPGQILKDHGVCYPPLQGADAVASELHPLYPDRLGEDFLALTLPGHRQSGYFADPWAETAVAQLLAAADGPQAPENGPLPWIRGAMSVLTETARRWPHVAELHLGPLLDARPGLALEGGGTVLTTIAGIPNIDVGILEAVEAILPANPHSDLDAGIAVLVRKLTGHRLATTSDPVSRAGIYQYLGDRLRAAGLYDESRAAIEDALSLYLKLANSNPSAYEPQLAYTLTRFASIVTSSRPGEDVLGAIEYAVLVYENLVARDPSYEPDLGYSLLVLGVVLLNLRPLFRQQGILFPGVQDRSTEVLEKATGIFERLSATDPESFEPQLADSLRLLAYAVGTHPWRRYQEETERPFSLAERALHISERLSTANPSAYEPLLVHSLIFFSTEASAKGQSDKALAAAIKAVEISRRLARKNASAFDDLYANSLITLISLQRYTNQPIDMYATMQEADQLLTRLEGTSPAMYQELEAEVRQWKSQAG